MRSILLLMSALFAAGCAGGGQLAEVAPPPRSQQPSPPAVVLPEPRQAEWREIDDGLAGPLKLVREQQPRLRPCWTFEDGAACLEPVEQRRTMVGSASELASVDDALAAARLDAARRWVELLSAERAADLAVNNGQAQLAPNPALERRVLSLLFAPELDSGIVQLWFWQRWEERRDGRVREFYRAFVLLDLPEELFSGR